MGDRTCFVSAITHTILYNYIDKIWWVYDKHIINTYHPVGANCVRPPHIPIMGEHSSPLQRCSFFSKI